MARISNHKGRYGYNIAGDGSWLGMPAREFPELKQLKPAKSPGMTKNFDRFAAIYSGSS